INDIQFSSGSAKLIAVTGRQKWKVYLASQAQMAASAMAMFKGKQPCVFFQCVALCGSDNLRNTVPVAWRRFGAGAVGPEQGDLSLLFCARRADSRAEFLDLVVIRRVLLTVEGGRARRTELRAAAHCKRRDESPLRQQIGKKCRRSRHPHARPAAARWRDYGIGTIVGARGEDLVRDEFTPHDACRLLWPIGDCSENRGMKRIEAGCRSREQIYERLVRCGASSGFKRRAGRR